MKRFLFLAGFYILKIIRAFFSLFNEKSFCEICSGSASFDMMVCKKCYCKFLDVKLNTENICSVCGKILVSEDDICLECRENKILKSCDKVFPIFPYILWNKKLLLRWKINGERQFSAFFAKVVYKRLCEIKEITGFFAVVPVPPRKGKMREKGWDQIMELSRLLKYVYGMKVVSMLERVSYVQQKKLDRLERLGTINRSYVLKKNLKEIPERAVIIDDVLTTGATIESCSFLLKKAGVKEVYAVSIFAVS